jgi:hypothetical protein
MKDPLGDTVGLGQAIGVANCRLGTGTAAHNEISIQFDDWIGADLLAGMTNGEDWNTAAASRASPRKRSVPITRRAGWQPATGAS